MALNISPKRDVQKAADIVRDAGGKVVGRTRLQKIAYLLELAGVGDGFTFEYRHYGPFSEDLAMASRNADLLDLLREVEHPTAWGGFYSIFSVDSQPAATVSEPRKALARAAAKADPIELELAATAAYLSSQGVSDPWQETARRKPEKTKSDRLEKAQSLYREFREIDTPVPLPYID